MDTLHVYACPTAYVDLSGILMGKLRMTQRSTAKQWSIVHPFVVPASFCDEILITAHRINIAGQFHQYESSNNHICIVQSYIKIRSKTCYAF